uniref:Uncharacterized protein n=1 Tax=Liagoropsis maxima TaxID=1653392 RepID=A0A1G4NVV8_9FLOR|nr:Hypothetical protein ycf41 [Liagoropsis maxima]SCW22765.1 Hypothetical protein ycf41 [Liagoropsis maxima]
MQAAILTIQIATWPQQTISSSGEIGTNFFVRILNSKKGKELYYIQAFSRGKVAENIFNLYIKGDYLVIESYLFNNFLKSKYNIIIWIIQEHPIFLPI